MKIEMFLVPSNNVHRIGYDVVSKTLRVEFQKGGLYDYLGVPEDVYKTLKMSSSIGVSLRHMIKGTYEFKKVEV